MSAARTAKWVRVGFAGPGAIVISVVIIAGMALWLPGGAAGIDNLILPLVLLPLIWAVLFFHACLDRKLARIVIVALVLFGLHAGLVAQKFLMKPAPVAGKAHK
ncbi:hypothetical protein [Sphingomonas sp. SRS2]|uniref:hypothetical protein n=1 Tax=Sphingomonas sp. SRS2 TaxID=133190 RepID=UPI0006184860|nr:hypothetical protein [Sphingomonas sp. SRS2]KKC26696.1 hypothetical protein WP12_07050 [Sphingomonas sp. SRS2]